MRSFKHWTPRYVYDRSRNILSNRVHPDWPWFTPSAVEFLNVWLKPTDDVFEWGSGRSTIWIAKRVHSITSVETNKDWFTRVGAIAEQRRLRDVHLQFFARNGSPENAHAYSSFISSAGKTFDLIVVDADYRDHCALAATKNLKTGGLLLVDNISWFLPSRSVSPSSRRPEDGPATPQWAQFLEAVSSWREIWTSNGVTDTAIWMKTP